MKFPIVVCPWLKVSGMALFPFILLKHQNNNYNSSLVFHERIHLRQQLELLIVPFYLLYLINYLFNFLYYKNHHQAYMNIVFEREAYANDQHRNYLKERRFWAFLSYL